MRNYAFTRLICSSEAICLFLLLQSVVVVKTWIECEYNAKALNLSMRLSRKHEVDAEA